MKFLSSQRRPLWLSGIAGAAVLGLHLLPGAVHVVPLVIVTLCGFAAWTLPALPVALAGGAVFLAQLVWLLPGAWQHPDWWAAVVVAGLTIAVVGRWRRAKSLLASVAGVVRTGIAAVDLEGRQTFVNDALCRMTGFARHDLVGRVAPFPYWSPARRAEIDAFLRRLTSDSTDLDEFETLFCRRDGSEFPVRITVSRILDGNGRTSGWSASVVDVSTQVAADTEDHRRNALTDSALSCAGVFRWRTGPDGVIRCSGPASDQFCESLAAALTAVIGGQGGSGRAKGVAGTAPDLMVTDPSGRPRYFELLDTPADSAGPDQGFVVDRTTIREAEQRSVTAARFEATARLAGQVWHDHLAHLTLARTIADGMARAAGDADQRERAGQMIVALDRATDIIRPLMVSARHAPSDTVAATPVRPLLESLAALLKVALSHDIVLDVTPPDQDVAVAAPEPDLFRHLLNLATNARDAMPNGGRLGIHARVTPDGGNLFIEVVDTGVGIPPPLLERVWEPFFSTKGADRGTGLGLPGVLAFARDHGGTVELRSTEGEGTVVGLVLPVAAAVPESDDSPARKGTVLLIEDDEVTGRMMTAALVRAGWQVSRASSLSQAEALLKLRRPDVLVSDLDIGGKPATDLLRAASADPGVRIVIVSGFAARYDLSRMRATVLDKPISLDALIAALGRHLPAVEMAAAAQ